MTPTEARDMHPDYRSASCDDVARRVDECIRLRAENETLRELVRDVYKRGMVSPEWDERAEKALGN